MHLHATIFVHLVGVHVLYRHTSMGGVYMWCAKFSESLILTICYIVSTNIVERLTKNDDFYIRVISEGLGEGL